MMICSRSADDALGLIAGRSPLRPATVAAGHVTSTRRAPTLRHRCAIALRRIGLTRCETLQFRVLGVEAAQAALSVGHNMLVQIMIGCRPGVGGSSGLRPHPRGV